MNEQFLGFQKKFRTTDLLVHTTRSWTWTVRPTQPTLGSGIISLNRHALELHEVATTEMADLAAMISIVEHTLKKSYDYRIMNYLALMMVDRHVHFHVIPRYDSTRDFDSKNWHDNGWPALPVMSDSQHAFDEMLVAIRDYLRHNLIV